ncbi:MAG: hypothetical protein JWM80_3227 [Cyanobacteria bacterium RYN_339]|nr:hypothetical protein [Cyanobacteria bacterium RYN_339]
MKPLIRSLVLACLPVALASCNVAVPGLAGAPGQTSVPGQAGAPGQAGVPGQAGAPGTASASNKLSQYNNASFADVVVGADKTIHVIYGDKKKLNDSLGVYYRSSKDGGASWSEPEILTAGDPIGREAGYMRLIQDGQGTIFALWKALTKDNVTADTASSSNAGSLVYRTLAGGGWGKLQSIGKADNTFAWFASVDPAGQLHLVWNEGSKYPISAGGPLANSGKAEVFEAPVSAGTVGQATLLITGQAAAGGAAPKNDVYDSLRGFVDAAGHTHFVAQKSPKEDPYKPILVYWNDGHEQNLGSLDSVTEKNNLFRNSPPVLLPDAQGQDHMIYWDQRADHPQVQDRLMDGKAAPVVIYQTKEAGGKVLNFEAYPGPGSTMVALVGAKDLKDPQAAAEMFLARSTASGWAAPTMLTNNNQAGTFMRVDTERRVGSNISQNVEYIPLYAAAGYDAAGSPHVVMINDAKTITSGYSYAGGTLGFTSAAPNVYYLKP